MRRDRRPATVPRIAEKLPVTRDRDDEELRIQLAGALSELRVSIEKAGALVRLTTRLVRVKFKEDEPGVRLSDIE